MKILNNLFHYVLFALLIPGASFIHTAEQPIDLPKLSPADRESRLDDIDDILISSLFNHLIVPNDRLNVEFYNKLINAISRKLGISIHDIVNATPPTSHPTFRDYKQTLAGKLPLIFWLITSTTVSLKNKKEITEYLIANGANTNFTIPPLRELPFHIRRYVREDDTLLHIAARLGDQELFNILASSGIDPTIRNAEGFTAQDILNRNPQTSTETNRQESSSSRIGSATINLNTQGRRAFRDRMGDFLNDMRSALDTLAGIDTKQ